MVCDSLLSTLKAASFEPTRMKALFGTRRGVVVIDRNGVIRFRKVVLPVFRPSDDEVIDAIRHAQKTEF